MTANQAAGKCRCGKERAPGLIDCASCRTNRRRNLTEHRKRRVAEGYCTACFNLPAMEGRTQCTFCAELQRLRFVAARMEAVAGYGGACQCCGESRVQFLELDHLERTWGEGRRPSSETGISLYLRIIKQEFPAGYQVLCGNCNWSKRIHGVCKRAHTGLSETKTYGTSDRSRSSRKLKLEVFAAYGGECVCCEEQDDDILNLDHVNEDGAEERRRIGQGAAGIYRLARATGFPDTYRLLCTQCNKRSFIDRSCPHGSELLQAATLLERATARITEVKAEAVAARRPVPGMAVIAQTAGAGTVGGDGRAATAARVRDEGAP